MFRKEGDVVSIRTNLLTATVLRYLRLLFTFLANRIPASFVCHNRHHTIYLKHFYGIDMIGWLVLSKVGEGH
jgi:hypothetical protein